MNNSLKTITICSFLMAICLLPAYADDIAVIQDIYKDTNAVIKDNKTTLYMFYTSDNGWRLAKDQKETEIEAINDIVQKAAVYIHNGRVVKTIITIYTPSGDWVGHQEYYFYENESTAFIFEELRTFQGYDTDKDELLPPGPYVIEKRVYYSQEHDMLRDIENAFILSSRKDIPIKYLRQIDFGRYKDVSSLPFSNVLKQNR